MTEYKYEIKRLILNKNYISFFILIYFFSYTVMKNKILFGIDHTAPYSDKSYVTYILIVSIIVIVSLMYFIYKYESKNSKMVDKLVKVTAVNFKYYKFIQYLAIWTGYFVLSLIPIVYSAIFYNHYFDYSNILELILIGEVIFQAEALLFTIIFMIIIKIKRVFDFYRKQRAVINEVIINE